MLRFLTLSLTFHAAAMAIITFVSGDWLVRHDPRPLGAFSISLDQVGEIASVARKREAPQSIRASAAETAVAENAAAEANVEGAKTEQSAGMAGAPDGVAVGLKERYLFELRLAIDREKKYPLAAKEMRQEGRVEVAFLVDVEGKFRGVELVGLSPFDRLNKAALSLVEGIGSFRPLPPELGLEPLRVSLPIDYVLK